MYTARAAQSPGTRPPARGVDKLVTAQCVTDDPAPLLQAAGDVLALADVQRPNVTAQPSPHLGRAAVRHDNHGYRPGAHPGKLPGIAGRPSPRTAPPRNGGGRLPGQPATIAQPPVTGGAGDAWPPPAAETLEVQVAGVGAQRDVQPARHVPAAVPGQRPAPGR